MAVGTQGPVKICDKALGRHGPVTDPHDKRREYRVQARSCHPRGFHFHGGCAPKLAAIALFSATVWATWSMEASTPVACGMSEAAAADRTRPCGLDCRGHKNIADVQRRIERSAKSHTDDHFRPALRNRDIERLWPACAAPAPFATIHNCLPSALAAPRPVTGQSNLRTPEQNAPKAHRTPAASAATNNIRWPETIPPPAPARLPRDPGSKSQLARGFVVRHPHLLARHAHRIERRPRRLPGDTRPSRRNHARGISHRVGQLQPSAPAAP